MIQKRHTEVHCVRLDVVDIHNETRVIMIDEHVVEFKEFFYEPAIVPET